jgi:putative salt-induced outer membrane protein
MTTTSSTRLVTAFLLCVGLAASVHAQPAAPPPPPLWDTQFGFAFVGTSGNTDTNTLGADFSLHRRWTVWQLESTASAVETTTNDERTAERLLAAVRGTRTLTPIIGVSTGERVEHDPFAGVDFRSIADVGLTYALARKTSWTLDATTAIAWSHEELTTGPSTNHPTGVLEAVSKIPLGASGKTTQRFTYYPDFEDSAAYRTEAEATAQAAMNNHLALKLGYLWRFSNEPVAGFKKADQTLTASVVLTFKATTPAP